MLVLALVGCTPDDSDVQDYDSPTAADEGPQPADLAALSSGQCPDLSASGASTFTSAGVSRTVNVYLPEDVQPGLPVIFMWHPLGITGSQIAIYLDAAGMARNEHVIVVAPESDPSHPFEWNFFGTGEGDIQLYDDLRTCLSNSLDVDLYRVYSTGMSAGGLWTTWLALHRSDTLATVLVMSGGTDGIIDYVTPATKFPALLMWGGATDTFGEGADLTDFNAAMIAFSRELRDDDHFVVECNHGLGHNIPPEGRSTTIAWLLPHRFGESSPFEDGDLTGLADYCTIP
jgi:poly(3-hydroxybutyrate) depolymerase